MNRLIRLISRLSMFASLSVLVSAAPAFELSPLFSNNAVFQRDQPVSIWGWDEPGTTVTVEFSGQKVSAEANEQGKWVATLQPLTLSKEPKELVVSAGTEKIVSKGILVGDVWLCSGQSNMEMTFQTPRLPCDMPDFVKPDEMAMVRQLRVAPVKTKKIPKELVEVPQNRFNPDQIKGGWVSCDAEAYKNFSASAFFFAYHLNKEAGVPIGLLNCTQGNTRIDQWISKKAGDAITEHVPAEKLRAVYSKVAHTNYNTQISPVSGFAIKGAIWYQGEANGKESDDYYWKLKALIEGWRGDWGQGEFPFFFVQLPSYNGKGTWAPIREAQRKVHVTVPNTGMVVLTDAGDNEAEFPINLHPRNKFVVGQRLAQWALAKAYAKQDVVPSGPLFKAADFKAGKAIVSFDHIGAGLMAAKKESSRSVEPPQPVAEVIGFEIAAKDGKWVEAKAVIEGDKIVLSASGVAEPMAVRYLYTMNTDHGTLYNKEGLPASPFLADDWQKD